MIAAASTSTIVNFNASGGDMIDLSHFTSFTTVQQLQR
jgi:hypothetical protein